MRAPTTTSQADLAGGVIDEGFVRFERGRSGGRCTPAPCCVRPPEAGHFARSACPTAGRTQPWMAPAGRVTDGADGRDESGHEHGQQAITSRTGPSNSPRTMRRTRATGAVRLNHSPSSRTGPS